MTHGKHDFQQMLRERSRLCPPDAGLLCSELRKRNSANKARFYMRWHMQGGALRAELERAWEVPT